MARGARRTTSASTSGAQPLRGGLSTTTSARSIARASSRATSPATKRASVDAVQRGRGGGVGDRAGVRLDADHLVARGARQRERDAARRRSRRRRRARPARPPARRAIAAYASAATSRLAWKKAPRRQPQPDARPPTSTRSSIVALAVEHRSSPASAAKMALPRPRLTCSTTPTTSGRAARNARASAGPFGSGRARRPRSRARGRRGSRAARRGADRRSACARRRRRRRAWSSSAAQRGRGVVERRLGDAAARGVDDVVRARRVGAQHQPAARCAPRTSFDRLR